jgi:site-specific DNA recombinase
VPVNPLLSHGGRICSRLKAADFSERQAILQLVVERIIVHGDTLEIHHVTPLRDPGPANALTALSVPHGTGLRSEGMGQAGDLGHAA